jgi:putative flavoprotein involved in K+ transport
MAVDTTISPPLDVVVVGGGQAGLGIAYFLRQAGQRFVVFERGRIGESWRSQRWDSFALNTPNWMNGLPGMPYDGPELDGFWLRDDLVASFEEYVARFDLPVRTGVTVQRVTPLSGNDAFRVQFTDANGNDEVLARAVVIASGIMQTPTIPQVATDLPEWITQLHTGDYRNPATLPAGAVIVVGGGQSGCQIAEDLIEAGRTVYLCTSRVGRIPRRYRSRDILEWWDESGFLDVTVDELDDPAVQFAAQPQVSGVGRYGRTVSLQHLARRGATLLGRVNGIQDETLLLDDSLEENVRFADEKSAQFKHDIDVQIGSAGESHKRENDRADLPDPALRLDDAPLYLNLREAGVGTVIWCTGFTADFSWIDAPVTDANGRPRHRRGVSPVPGLYFLGFPWLHRRKSGIIYGIEEDAAFLATEIASRL